MSVGVMRMAALIVLTMQPAVALAQKGFDHHVNQMQGLIGQMEHPAVSHQLS